MSLDYPSVCIDDYKPKLNEVTTFKVMYPFASFIRDHYACEGEVIYCVDCEDGIVFIVQLPPGKWDRATDY